MATSQDDKADGHAIKLIWRVLLRHSAAQHNEHKHGRVQQLPGSRIAGIERWHGCHHRQVGCTDDLVDRSSRESPQKLEEPVRHHPTKGLLPQQSHCEGHGRVQMPTRDRTRGVDHHHQHRGNGSRRPWRRRGRSHDASDREYERKGAKTFCKKRRQPLEKRVQDDLHVLVGIAHHFIQDLLWREPRPLAGLPSRTVSSRGRAVGSIRLAFQQGSLRSFSRLCRGHCEPR
mmetsp:Transcript_12356/g.17400  ORF Transcript_12356/g.17400 Transcript_12356/m.17400 type:complete len:230 (-) Transcript_12356:71-760(-)